MRAECFGRSQGAPVELSRRSPRRSQSIFGPRFKGKDEIDRVRANIEADFGEGQIRGAASCCNLKVASLARSRTRWCDATGSVLRDKTRSRCAASRSLTASCARLGVLVDAWSSAEEPQAISRRTRWCRLLRINATTWNLQK